MTDDWSYMFEALRRADCPKMDGSHQVDTRSFRAALRRVHDQHRKLVEALGEVVTALEEVSDEPGN